MYTTRFVMDHVEIYTIDGTFLFSADTLSEAQKMMEE